MSISLKYFTSLVLVMLSTTTLPLLVQAEQVANVARVEIYTASYCSDCKQAKAYMKTHNITFDEYDIEHDLVRRKEFYARGGKGVPFIVVKGRMMHGFDAGLLEALLK